MKDLRRLLTISAAVLCLVLVGCAKPQPQPIQETPPPPPPPPPPQVWEPDTTVFEPVVDLDQLIRENLRPVFFAFNRHDLSPEALRLLQVAAEFLNRHPDIRVRLDGHTDSRGTTEYNLALGERRSRSVRDALVRFGVNTGRLEMTSFGKERPARHNCGAADEDCHQANRRVEYTVIRR